MKLFETKIEKEDVEKISKILQKGELGFGENVSIFEERYQKFSNKKFNIATNSASAAAFMIFSFLREKFGTCDVYTTTLGFTSPAWAAKHFNHNLFFVDTQDDLQFSSDHYRKIRKETNNKVVIMPVLYGGISTIESFKIFGDEIVVLDSAHCATPKLECDYSFFSFHPFKPICSSDGGMISTEDPEADQFFRNYRNFGRKQRGDTYEIVTDGFKFYMNNLNATIALTQIEKYDKNLTIRKENYLNLKSRFNLLEHDKNSSYYFATTFTEEANDVISNKGLTRNYPMLHKMKFYENGLILPNIESLHSKILNLPLWCSYE